MAEQENNRIFDLAFELNELTKDYSYEEMHLAFALFFSGISFSLIKDETEFSKEDLENIITKYPNTYPAYLASVSLSLLETAKVF